MVEKLAGNFLYVSFDAQALLDNGTHRICESCHHVVPNRPACRCGARVSPVRVAFTASHTQPGHTTVDQLGGLAVMPDHVLWLVVLGQPESQGSMRAPAAGVVTPDNPRMKKWRRTVTEAARQLCTDQWAPIDGAVIVDICFTVAAPKYAVSGKNNDCGRRAPTRKTDKDKDKLTRAIGDALSPLSKRGTAASSPFKVLVDDSRIVDGAEAKTFPSPAHTHAWALPEPGVVIRVSSLDSPIEPPPRSTLRLPQSTPQPIVDAYAVASRRGIGAFM